MSNKIEVLVATMNLTDCDELLKKMNLKKNVLIINQITSNKDIKEDTNINTIRIKNYYEKGLSKSRNRALDNAYGDICVISDDDLTYLNNFEHIVREAYKEHPNADIIAFKVEYLNGKSVSSINRKKVNYLHSMKLCSVQLTFKKDVVKSKKIRFDERFGTGSGIYNMGEENIFLFDCLKAGLKIYYVDETIAYLKDSESSWFKGYTPDYFKAKGACYCRMSKRFCLILILQFAVRKYALYKGNLSFWKVLKLMKSGAKELNTK